MLVADEAASGRWSAERETIAARASPRCEQVAGNLPIYIRALLRQAEEERRHDLRPACLHPALRLGGGGSGGPDAYCALSCTPRERHDGEEPLFQHVNGPMRLLCDRFDLRRHEALSLVLAPQRKAACALRGPGRRRTIMVTWRRRQRENGQMCTAWRKLRRG